MSSMDGFCDPKTIVKTAHRMGHRAVAVTDHGVVPVSYTHLDVYKRQVLSSLQLLRRRLCRPGKDIADGVEKYLDYAEQNLYKTCLLYTSNLLRVQAGKTAAGKSNGDSCVFFVRSHDCIK